VAILRGGAGVGLLSAAFLLCAGVRTEAQELEEIIVVAQKREQNLQDVPISIAAFSGETVQSLGWLDAEDIAGQTPGLIATSFSGDSTVSIFSIRGVAQNDFADHQEAPVAVYVDGAYVGFTGAAGVQLFDIERVEVLRGPQGTLFGRNATGGLVHLISKRPTESTEAYLDVTVGEFSQMRLEGAVSGSLTDTLRGRLSILSDQADGYFKNNVGKDARDRDFLNVRAQLEFLPSDQFDGLLSLRSNQTNKTVGGAYDFRTSLVELGDIPTDFQGTPDSTPGVNDGDLNPLGFNDKEATGATLTLRFRPGDLELVSITDYGEFEKSYGEDSDGNISRTLEYIAEQDATQFSQEIRIGGEGARYQWLAGAYYLDLDGDYFTDLNAPTFGGAAIQNYSLETRSWSLFGQFEYELTPATRLTAGVRWINDEKDYALLSVCQPADTLPPGEVFLPGFPPNDCALFTSGDPANPLVIEAGQINLSRDDSDFAGVLGLSHQLNPDVMMYASLDRGMKGGGYTAPLDGFLTVPEIVYEPEILNSLEVGIKSTFADGRARLNAAAFVYDYEDYQGYVFQGLTSQVRNFDAEIHGGELELELAPAEGLFASLGVSVLDATVKDVELASGGAADQQMITAPDLSLNLLARKTWDVSQGGSISLQVDGRYVDEQQYNTTNSALTLGGDYSVWNASLGYSHSGPDSEWSASVFVNNVFDEVYSTYRFDLSAFFGYSLIVHAPPRWIGARFRYSWK
jgi:iron complex outermembrane recepter protein